MTERRRKIIKKKWLWVIVSFLMILLLFSIVLDPLVKNLLVKQVASQTQSKYSLEVDQLDCSILKRELYFSSIRLVPHPHRARGANAEGLLSFNAEELQMKGIHLWRLIWDSEFVVDQLDIANPAVAWKHGSQNIDSLTNENETENDTPFIQIGQFNLEKGSLTVIAHDSTESMTIADATIYMKSFIYDEKRTSTRYFDFEDFSLLLKDYTMMLPDSFYSLQANAITASAQSKKVEVAALELIPLYGPLEFMEKKGEQADRINMFVKKLLIEGLDFEQLMEKELVASFINIDSLNLVAYRDKRYILPADKYVKFPQQALREFPHYVHIDSLLLGNAQITYRERVEGGEAPGAINFVNVNALTHNITNDSLLLNDSIAMVTNATGYLMGAGKINAHINIPIGNQHNIHYFEGTMSPMEMKVVNPMLRNIVFGEIVSGRVNELSFRAYVNEDESQGTMHFGYEDLKVQINHKDSEKGRKGLITFVANSFIVKSDNPSNNKFRESEMHYVRDKRKSLINFWWKTLLSGFKETMGVPEGKEKDRP